MIEPDRPDLDLLERGPSAPGPLSRLTGAWAGASRRSRSAVVGLATGSVLAGALAYGLTEVRAWTAQKAAEDQVALTATLSVTASSTTPVGGRVDFSLSVQNLGPLPVSITGVGAAGPRLTIAGRDVERAPVVPGQQAQVPLSVLLDCREPAAVTGNLVAAIRVVPVNGRERSLAVEVTDSRLVTDVADTLCRIDPELHDHELDGPVAS